MHIQYGNLMYALHYVHSLNFVTSEKLTDNTLFYRRVYSLGIYIWNEIKLLFFDYLRQYFPACHFHETNVYGSTTTFAFLLDLK